jgi:hypothetical protein
MATKSELISDVELRLTKGKPSDDLELERDQIGHWIDVVRDEIVSDFVQSAYKRGDTISSEYIKKEACISFSEETDSCVENQRKFITLANAVLNLPDDKGIVKIYTNNYEVVYPTFLEELDMVRDMPFSAPTDEMYIYHREGPSKLVVSGINNNPVTAPSFIVFYIIGAVNSNIPETSEYPIGNDLTSLLLDRVEEIGRRQLYASVEDLENDSEQDING